MNWRPALLGGLSIVVILVVAMLDPIPQDVGYYAFADQRSGLGMPNYLNVLSNVPFIFVGLMGWRHLSTHSEAVTPATRTAWWIFFLGIALTAFGSGYFHLRPNTSTLIWDRLPMTIGFMSLASIIIAEYFSERLGQKALVPLLIAGMASVAYWAYTESHGMGDLRPYAIVQFLPMLLIPMVMLLYRTNSDLGRYLWWMIGFYLAAKVAEHYDAAIFAAFGLASGHTLKHLLASLAPASLLVGLMGRRHRV